MSRRRGEQRLRAHCAASGALCLTFDDGPSESLTPSVLEALREAGASATFFMLGARAVERPAIVQRVIDEGHEIGCHSQQHCNAWKTRPGRAAADVDAGFTDLARWNGDRPLFRPPYGKLTPWTAAAARRRGARIGWWTVDSGDTWTRLPDTSDMVDRVERDGGGVVLLHDFDRTGSDATARAAFVIGVTRALLELAHQHGWRITTLGRVMEDMENGRE